MKVELLATLLAAIFALTGCSTGDSSSDESANGSINIELPEINTTANRVGVSDIDMFVLQITSDEIEYTNTIESETGGIITVEKLAEARYEILIEAFDADGDAILAGNNFAQVYVGEVTYAQIELDYTFGELDIAVVLPGDDFVVDIEIEGIPLNDEDEVTVVHGPGIYISRVGVPSSYLPGPSSTKVFSIETGGDNAETLKFWFDEEPDLRSAILNINTIAGDLRYQWIMFDMSPKFYKEGTDDQTQFYFSVLLYEAPDIPGGLATSYDEGKDKGIEIEGVVFDMAASVVDDVENQTLKLTFDFENGLRGIYDWTKDFEDGIHALRAMSVITYGPAGFGDEISRRNYFETFVLSFEQINGFQNDIEGRFRVVLSYDASEDG